MLCGWEGEPQAWRRVAAAAAGGTLVYTTKRYCGLSAYETGDRPMVVLSA